jgi:hypothetical protein
MCIPKTMFTFSAILLLTLVFHPMALATKGSSQVELWHVPSQMLQDTFAMLQTVNVKQLDRVSSTPISHMLHEKALMNEVVQQLESNQLPASDVHYK